MWRQSLASEDDGGSWRCYPRSVAGDWTFHSLPPNRAPSLRAKHRLRVDYGKMKPLALMIVVLAAVALRADDAALVNAAKKVPPNTVITNESVKKGAVPSGGATAVPATAETPKGLLQIQAEQKQQRVAAEARLHDAEAVVDKLQLELAAVEQSYYDESNPDVRDVEITKRFGLVQTKLEAARKDLTAARDAVAALPTIVKVHE